MDVTSRAWVSRVRYLLKFDQVRFDACVDPEIPAVHKTALEAVTSRDEGPFTRHELMAIMRCTEWAEEMYRTHKFPARRNSNIVRQDYMYLKKISRIKLTTGGN